MGSRSSQRNDGGWCECSECGRTFTGLRGFDAHRINTTGQPGYDPEYDWRCATDAELKARGYRTDGRGWWGSVRTDVRFGRPTNTRTPVEGENVRDVEGAR